MGVPEYFRQVAFQVNEKKTVMRGVDQDVSSAFTSKIEWVWLYEQHTDLYLKAMEYKKNGYTRMQEELKNRKK